MNSAPWVRDPPAVIEPMPGGASLRDYIRTVRENSLKAWHSSAYDEFYSVRRVGLARHVAVHDPQGIRRILADNVGNYRRDPVSLRLLQSLIGKGLLTTEGEEWRKQRRLLAPLFTPRFVFGFQEEIAPMVDRAVDQLELAARRNGAMELTAWLTDLTLRILSRILFSTDADVGAAVVGNIVARHQAEIRPDLLGLARLPRIPNLASAFRTVLRKRRMRGVVTSLLASRRGHAGGARDLLDRLVEVEDGILETRAGLRQVSDQVATLMIAGHETTSSAIGWALYLLAVHPDEQERVYADLREADFASASGLLQSGRLQMVIAETLRLYPPVHTMSRVAVGPDLVGTTEIRRGDFIFISPWILHRHRRLWRRPDHFDPENFVPEVADSRDRYAYLPFGAGPRTCIGATLAQLEAAIILSRLIARFRFSLVGEPPVEPIGLITLRARQGIHLHVQPRR